MNTRTILFISAMEGDPWGGSEELWSETAKTLTARGIHVAASVHSWTPLHPRIQSLLEHGVDVRPRVAPRSLLRLARRTLMRRRMRPRWTSDIEMLIAETRPALVVLSDGRALPAIDLIELLARKCPFVTIAHNNFEYWWPDDHLVPLYRHAFAKASSCFFVSEANKILLEKMLCCRLNNAAIVRNPFNVRFDAQPSWTPLSENGPLHLACVGRLDIRAKGQDVLLEALARDAWLKRNWKLTLYGDGPTKAGIKSMISDLKLSDRVSIAGHVDHIDAIWRTNHVLVQPSRHEGLPLSVVEAMLCARPVIATKVGGHAEVVVEGATGFLADAATPNSIAEALERAWQARPYLDQLGKNGAEKSGKLCRASRHRPSQRSYLLFYNCDKTLHKSRA